MAGVAMRRCASTRSTDTELTQTHFDNDETVLNGKINHNKNGYQKTADINNEVTVSKYFILFVKLYFLLRIHACGFVFSALSFLLVFLTQY